jgi:hypothetical protein
MTLILIIGTTMNQMIQMRFLLYETKRKPSNLPEELMMMIMMMMMKLKMMMMMVMMTRMMEMMVLMIEMMTIMIEMLCDWS